MGGAILTVTDKDTKEQAESQLNRLLNEAYERGLVDVRAKIEPYQDESGKWRAGAWVHS
jgi:hypothetical protein